LAVFDGVSDKSPDGVAAAFSRMTLRQNQFRKDKRILLSDVN
jgi:hypothetical protein